MALTVLHVFAPISAYAYLGIGELLDMQRRLGFSIAHAPVDIQAVFAAAGVTPPAAQSDCRKTCRRQDMQRWARRRNLLLNLAPKFWPANGALASRYIFAADFTAQEPAKQRSGEMAQAILAAVWARDLDIADEKTLQQLAREIGIDGATLANAAQSPEVQERAVRATQEAIARGLFGSPNYIIGSDHFFGQDRLDFLEEAIRDHQSVIPSRLNALTDHVECASSDLSLKRSKHVHLQESVRQVPQVARRMQLWRAGKQRA